MQEFVSFMMRKTICIDDGERTSRKRKAKSRKGRGKLLKPGGSGVSGDRIQSGGSRLRLAEEDTSLTQARGNELKSADVKMGRKLRECIFYLFSLLNKKIRVYKLDSLKKKSAIFILKAYKFAKKKLKSKACFSPCS